MTAVRLTGAQEPEGKPSHQPRTTTDTMNPGEPNQQPNPRPSQQPSKHPREHKPRAKSSQSNSQEQQRLSKQTSSLQHSVAEDLSPLPSPLPPQLCKVAARGPLWGEQLLRKVGEGGGRGGGGAPPKNAKSKIHPRRPHQHRLDAKHTARPPHMQLPRKPRARRTAHKRQTESTHFSNHPSISATCHTLRASVV